MGNGQTKGLTVSQLQAWEAANKHIDELTETNSRLRELSRQNTLQLEEKNRELDDAKRLVNARIMEYQTEKTQLKVKLDSYEKKIILLAKQKNDADANVILLQEKVKKKEDLEKRCEAQRSHLNGLNKAHQNLLKSQNELQIAHQKLVNSDKDSTEELMQSNCQLIKDLEEKSSLVTSLQAENYDKAEEVKRLKGRNRQLEKEKGQFRTLKEQLITAKNRALEEKEELNEEFESYKKKLDCTFDKTSNCDMINVEAVGAIYNLYKEYKEKYDALKDHKPEVKNENKQTETFDCTICLESKVTDDRVTFSPCGHGCCSDCASKLSLSQANCHLCRTPIRRKIKQFKQ